MLIIEIKQLRDFYLQYKRVNFWSIEKVNSIWKKQKKVTD